MAKLNIDQATAITRSYFFRMADLGTLVWLAGSELIARSFFDTHLSIWYAMGYLLASALGNHVTYKYRVKKALKA